MFGRRKPAVRRRRSEGGSRWLKPGALPWRRLLPAASVLGVVAGTLLLLRLVLDQPVERVSVSGRFQRVQALEVEKAVREAVGREGMVGVDLARIAAAVERIAWVDRASVARTWPRSLTVQVVEQTPVARWGEQGLVNVRGEIFVQDSRHIPPELPELSGPESRAALMTQRYLAVSPRLIEAGMRLMRLTLDERGAWEALLDNGVTLRLGREHLDERFDRFMQAGVRVVAPRAGEIAYVDLRYANGFAVGWRAAGERKRGQT